MSFGPAFSSMDGTFRTDVHKKKLSPQLSLIFISPSVLFCCSTSQAGCCSLDTVTCSPHLLLQLSISAVILTLISLSSISHHPLRVPFSPLFSSKVHWAPINYCPSLSYNSLPVVTTRGALVTMCIYADFVSFFSYTATVCHNYWCTLLHQLRLSAVGCSIV